MPFPNPAARRLVDSFGSTRRRRQLREREEGVVKVEKLGAAAGALATMITQVGEQAAREGLTKAEVGVAELVGR